MKLQELIGFMDTLAPRELAEDWDNVGLMCGDPQAQIDTVVVALDADGPTIAFAEEHGAQVIVSHHPLIFSPVKRIQAPSPLYRLATSGMACFSAHTNLDAAQGGVNDALAQVLGLTCVSQAFSGIGRMGELSEPMTPEAFAKRVGEALKTSVQFRGGSCLIRTVALVGGSGGEYALETDADAFVTGEVKHHEWLALPSSKTLVCAGHYATENVVVEPLSRAIENAFPMLRVLPFMSEAPYRFV